MAGGIFMIGDAGALVPYNAESYANEDKLQTYVEQYPDLLASDQINAEVPRRWVLVKRESPIPASDSGAARWSVDHLFLDQDGVPTLVEVKRSSDTRIRREVIGQMMEYAAHAVVFWPVEKMRAEFEATCQKAGVEPTARLSTLLDIQDETSLDDEVNAFWRGVQQNLEQGRLRLLFVADELPPETKRIIEFLNEKMADVEVLAVEIRQFVGNGRPILVPRLHGQTEAARQRKGEPRQTKTWDEAAYFGKLEAEHPEFLDVTRRIYDWAHAKGLTPTWGSGTSVGSISPRVGGVRSGPRVITIYTSGTLELAFAHLKPPFDGPERKRELMSRFADVLGVQFPAGAESATPNVSLSPLLDEAVLEQFLAVVDWWASETQAVA
jgi:hypothetical protein